MCGCEGGCEKDEEGDEDGKDKGEEVVAHAGSRSASSHCETSKLGIRSCYTGNWTGVRSLPAP